MNKILFAFASLLFALPAIAQNEAGVWSEVSVEKEWSKRFSTELSLGQRQEDNLNQATRWDAGLGLNYKVSSAFRIGAGYVYLHDYSAEEATPRFNASGQISGYNVDAPFWRDKHRFYLDLVLRHRFNKRWSVHFRERFQHTRNMGATTTEYKYRAVATEGYTGELYPYNGTDFMRRESEPDHKSAKTRKYVRHRIGVDYNIKGLPLEPYATYEMTNDASNALSVVRHRATIGTKWKLSKQHSLSIGYLYQRGEMDNGENGNLHILELGYKFKF